MKRLFTWVRNAINHLILWLAFSLSLVGGLAATGTFIASWTSNLVNIGPWWLPYLLGFIGFVCVLGDLAKEGIPERLAVYIPMLWPSVVLSIPKDAKLRKELVGWVDSLSHWLDGNLAEWVGKGGSHAIMTITATTFIGTAIFIMERYAKAAGKVGLSNATGSTSPSPMAARRAGR